MGNGGSKVNTTEAVSSAPQANASTPIDRPATDFDGTLQATKRQRESDPEPVQLSKRRKRSTSDDVAAITTNPRCSSGGEHRYGENLADRTKRNSIPALEEDTVAPNRIPFSVPVPLCHGGELEPSGLSDGAHILTGNNSHSKDQSQPETQYFECVADFRSGLESPTPTSGGSPCLLPSELSQQMSSQLEQASQAIQQAAAASQELEHVVPSGWKDAPDRGISREQREQNRQLLQDAIQKIHEISASDLVSTRNTLARSRTYLRYSWRISGQSAFMDLGSQAGKKRSEVDFVAEAKVNNQAYTFTGYAVRRDSRRKSSVDNSRILQLGDDGPRKPKEQRPRPARREYSGSGRQRKLTGCWKGWDEGILLSRRSLY